MEARHLHEHQLREETYWWFVNKRRIVHALLARYLEPGAAILEAGCGAGLEAALLESKGWQVTASDVHVEAARLARERGVNRLVVFDAQRQAPLAAESFDAVVMLDVLEHLEDDRTALEWAYSVLRAGGIALLTIPAHPWLYSGWDAVFGHQRRYSKAGLLYLAQDIGFEPVKVTYWNLVSLLPALVARGGTRLAGQKEAKPAFPSVPRWMNALLETWGRGEAAFVTGPGLPAGLSLVAVLRKDMGKA